MTPEIKERIDQIRHGIVPEGYKKGKLGIVPAEWNEVPFSTLFTTTNDYTDNLERYPLYSLTIEDGITAKTERYERSHLVKRENSYKVVRPDDYAYNPMNIRFGAVARHKGSKPVAVSGYYDIFATVNECDHVFMDSFLTCGPMITYYNKVSKGSLVEKQRVHFSDFLAFSLPLPPLGERIKIAEILSVQDKVIELEQQKIEEIMKAKRFFLEKMFPKKSETVPEIRFKGFTDPWEQRKLGDISEIKTGPFGSTLHADDYVCDGIPIITTEHFKAGTLPTDKCGLPQVSENDFNRLSAYVLNEGDIVFSRVGSVDINALITPFQRNWLFSGRILRVRPQGKHSSQFLHTLLETENVKSDIRTRAVGQTMPSINTEILKITPLLLPASLTEQELLGENFHSLDRLITLHQRKLEEEKKKKKALMQLLLTGIVRV